MKKINPEVFKKVAEIIERYMGEGRGIGCCVAFQIALNLDIISDPEVSIEYQFFKKMFYKKTPTGYWFGRPMRNKWLGVNKANQRKRIAALMKAYKEAKK